MQRSNSVEVIAVRQEPASRRVNSCVKKMIFAAAVVLCAGRWRARKPFLR
jgi:hypothetical protein